MGETYGHMMARFQQEKDADTQVASATPAFSLDAPAAAPDVPSPVPQAPAPAPTPVSTAPAPAADVDPKYQAYIAAGIRKKFADQFDLSGLTDQQIIERHHARFGADMTPQDYAAQIDAVYGKGYARPEGVLDVAKKLPGVAKDVAIGSIPYMLPHIASHVLPSIAHAVPALSQAAFGAWHAGEALSALQQDRTAKGELAAIPANDVESRAQELYATLQGPLTVKGYSPEQIKQEAWQRAVQLSTENRQRLQGEADAAEHKAFVTEPAHAASDAFFMGVGGKQIEGLLQKGLERVGLANAPMIQRLVQHVTTGALIGGGGLGIQGAVEHGLDALVANKSPREFGEALVKGGLEGATKGASIGAKIGGVAGLFEPVIGRLARPVLQRMQDKQQGAALDIARLQGWAKGEQDLIPAHRAAAKLEAIGRTVENFSPHKDPGITATTDPAEAATSIIQKEHGSDAALSEAGLRAATQIESKIRLYQDAEFALHDPNGAFPSTPRPPLQMGSRGFERFLIAPTEGRPVPEPAPTPSSPTVGQSPEPVAQAASSSPVVPTSPPVPAPQAMQMPEAPSPAKPKTVQDALDEVRQSTEQGVAKLEGEAQKLRDARTARQQAPKLPQDLAGAKPRYAYGEKQYKLAFDSDVDRALYITSQITKSKRDADFQSFLTEQGLSPGEIKVRKQQLRDTIKAMAKAGKHGETLTIPNQQSSAPAASRIADALQARPRFKALMSKGSGTFTTTPEGELHIQGLKGPENTPGATGLILDDVAEEADAHKVPVLIRITKATGPRGGSIPIEKMLPWYEKRGFKFVEGHKLPEGQYATATLRREPQEK